MPQQYKSAKRKMKKPAMSHGDKPKMYGEPKMYNDKRPKAKFPDLSGDGKVTKKDILMGRGVIDKPKMLKNKRKDVAGKAMMAYAKPAMYDKPKGYVSDAQRKAVHASKEDGGAGNPNKPKMRRSYKSVQGEGERQTMTKTTLRNRKGNTELKRTIKKVSAKKGERVRKREAKKDVRGQKRTQREIDRLVSKGYMPKMAHGNKPKMGRRVDLTRTGRKTKELGLTGAVKDKRVDTVGGKRTLTKTKTRVGGAKTTQEKNITKKRAARIAKRYNK